MIEWIQTKNDLSVPKQNGILLCSGIDPSAEAKKWISKLPYKLEDYDVFFVLGLGGGYHVSQLALAAKHAEIIVIEKNEELTTQLMSRRGKFASNVTVLSGFEIKEVAESVFVRSGIKCLYKVMPYPPSTRLDAGYYNEISTLLYGRTAQGLCNHLAVRSNLKKLFDDIGIDGSSAKDLTVIDIEEKIKSKKAVLDRESMIFLMLREFLK